MDQYLTLGIPEVLNEVFWVEVIIIVVIVFHWHLQCARCCVQMHDGDMVFLTKRLPSEVVSVRVKIKRRQYCILPF